MEGDADFARWYAAERDLLVSALAVFAADRDRATDAVDEAFTRAYSRWGRVGLMESPTGWVRTVAVNVLRRRLRRAAMEARLLQRRRVTEPAPAEVDPTVWSAVAGLPPRQRAVIALRVVLDLSQEETARLLGVRPGTVSAALVAARRALAAQLDPDEVTHA